VIRVWYKGKGYGKMRHTLYWIRETVAKGNNHQVVIYKVQNGTATELDTRLVQGQPGGKLKNESPAKASKGGEKLFAHVLSGILKNPKHLRGNEGEPHGRFWNFGRRGKGGHHTAGPC